MSSTITIDAFFLFFILIVFLLDIIETKIPLVMILSLGITALCIIPNVVTAYISNAMIGTFAIIEILFTFGISIVVAIETIGAD
jgi:hypothetical protein